MGQQVKKQESPAGGETSNVGMLEQLASFNGAFWISNGMEMLERLAYYGLRVVLPIYLVLSVAEGGPEFSHTQKAFIYSWWAVVQSFLPIVTGGYADRYGYKLTVGVSIAIKVLGYLGMAYAVNVADILRGGPTTEAGDPTTLAVFMVGALLLAAGTAIFKPGIQGLLATNLDESNSSFGWSIFYQLVNLGAFIGPFLAGGMKLLAWKYVFLSCAAIVSLNYILLLFLDEPAAARWPGGKRPLGTFGQEIVGMVKTGAEAVYGIFKPRIAAFLVVFSGFWAMFYQLFDLLPNYITDWVDSSDVYNAVVVPVFTVFNAFPPMDWNGQVPQEQLINLNAGMIMIFAGVMGYFTGKVRSLTAMIIGMGIAGVGIYGLGGATNGLLLLGAISIFSVGEMWASPTKMRYFASIAPKGQEGLYLGYVNATVGIGWGLGSIVAGEMYQEGGDKVVLARKYLTETLGQSADAVSALTKDEVVPRLMELSSQSALEVQTMLFQTYNPAFVWQHFCLVGAVSMLGLFLFDRVTQLNLAENKETAVLVVMTGVIAGWTYGWVWGLVFGGGIVIREGLRVMLGREH